MRIAAPDSGVTSRVSKTLIAIVLFAAVNLVWAKSQFGLLSALDYPHQTWTGTAVDDFLRCKNGRAQVAFLGSSLMVTPIVAVDATYLQQQLDAPYHHRSVYFEDSYKRLAGRNVSTFNFAIPGEMPSDAYLITKFLFQGDKRPDVLVYGVGPRDFLDNLLPSASSTDPYKHLSRFGDVTDHIHLVLGDWQEKLSYRLGRLFFTYGHKDDLACSFGRALSKATVPNLPPETAKQEWEYKQMVIPNYREFEVLPEACLVHPLQAGKHARFKDNLEEYRDRYHELKWETFLSQLQFLAETLDLARERKIQTVLVAMPITHGNRELISDFVWNLYKQNLRVIAHLTGAHFIDMQASTDFPSSDFADTVHLNEVGGARFLDTLVSKMNAENSVKMALAPRKFKDESMSLPANSMVAGLKGTGL